MHEHNWVSIIFGLFSMGFTLASAILNLGLSAKRVDFGKSLFLASGMMVIVLSFIYSLIVTLEFLSGPNSLRGHVGGYLFIPFNPNHHLPRELKKSASWHLKLFTYVADANGRSIYIVK